MEANKFLYKYKHCINLYKFARTECHGWCVLGCNWQVQMPSLTVGRSIFFVTRFIKACIASYAPLSSHKLVLALLKMRKSQGFCTRTRTSIRTACAWNTNCWKSYPNVIWLIICKPLAVISSDLYRHTFLIKISKLWERRHTWIWNSHVIPNMGLCWCLATGMCLWMDRALASWCNAMRCFKLHWTRTEHVELLSNTGVSNWGISGENNWVTGPSLCMHWWAPPSSQTSHTWCWTSARTQYMPWLYMTLTGLSHIWSWNNTHGSIHTNL